MIRVALVDDHALIRSGLRRAVERAEGMTTVAEAASIREADAVIRHTSPDVAVVDIRLPDGNGLELCRTLTDENLVRGVVVLSMYGDERRLLGARDSGASVFVAKDAPASQVIEGIRHAYGEPGRFIADGLADAIKDEAVRIGLLTPREQEVLNLLARGQSVAQISSSLFISESTTKTHVAKIYSKLGAANRAQALMTALDLGLIRREDDPF
jgi:DNA-binding NarL/FixJ family response regulator